MASILAGTATSIAALSQASTLVSSLSNLLLATPQGTKGYQPQSAPTATGQVSPLTPSPAILFNYEGEQSLVLASDITDHFTEDNTALQDQIALKPIVINTHGFIGELNNVPPIGLAQLQIAANTLTTVGSFIPGLSSTAQLAYDMAFSAYQLAASAANSGVAAVSSIAGGASQNQQQTYFQLFYGYWQTRTLFTVQTPWAIFQNMAILNCRPVQDSETRMITDFEVSFKQIQVASSQTTSGAKQTQGRASTQQAAAQNNGTGAISPSISVNSGLQAMGVK